MEDDTVMFLLVIIVTYMVLNNNTAGYTYVRPMNFTVDNISFYIADNITEWCGDRALGCVYCSTDMECRKDVYLRSKNNFTEVCDHELCHILDKLDDPLCNVHKHYKECDSFLNIIE